MANIAIVCGYGLVGDTYRSPIEMLGLTDYYQTVNSYTASINSKLIVFTGGNTNQNFPEVYESVTAIEFWKQMRRKAGFQENLDVQLMPEQKSTTSEANIYYSIMLLLLENMLKRTDDELWIFCDLPRYWKMKIICFFFLKLNGVKYKIHPCNRIDTNTRSNAFFQFFIAIPKMLLTPKFWKKYLRLKTLINYR